MRSLARITTLLALAGMLAAPAHGVPDSRDAGATHAGTGRVRVAAEAAVSIRTFQFAPDTVRVRVGSRVVWSNADDIEHTITSGIPETRDGHFHGVVDKRGATYSAVLEQAGTYRYFCDRHRFMNGTVIVTR